MQNPLHFPPPPKVTRRPVASYLFPLLLALSAFMLPACDSDELLVSAETPVVEAEAPRSLHLWRDAKEPLLEKAEREARIAQLEEWEAAGDYPTSRTAAELTWDLELWANRDAAGLTSHPSNFQGNNTQAFETYLMRFQDVLIPLGPHANADALSQSVVPSDMPALRARLAAKAQEMINPFVGTTYEARYAITNAMLGVDTLGQGYIAAAVGVYLGKVGTADGGGGPENFFPPAPLSDDEQALADERENSPPASPCAPSGTRPVTSDWPRWNNNSLPCSDKAPAGEVARSYANAAKMVDGQRLPGTCNEIPAAAFYPYNYVASGNVSKSFYRAYDGGGSFNTPPNGCLGFEHLYNAGGRSRSGNCCPWPFGCVDQEVATWMTDHIDDAVMYVRANGGFGQPRPSQIRFFCTDSYTLDGLLGDNCGLGASAYVDLMYIVE